MRVNSDIGGMGRSKLETVSYVTFREGAENERKCAKIAIPVQKYTVGILTVATLFENLTRKVFIKYQAPYRGTKN